MTTINKTAVVMLVNEFAPLPSGGGEVQAERLAVQLVKQDVRVGVITRWADGLPLYEERDGFFVKRIRAIGPGKLKSLSFLIGAMWTLFRYRREFGIAHAHLAFTPAVAASIMGRLFNMPVLILYGNSGEFGEIQSAQLTLRGRLKLELFRRWADVNIALDQQIEAELFDAGFSPDHVKLIVNGIDASEFAPVGEKSMSKKSIGLAGKTIIVFVGRLAPQKDIPTLIEAFHQASSRRPELHLLLLGDGPERQNLEQLVRRYKLEQQISFLGNVSDVRPYLQASDIFVLSSLSEGVSNALLEAMASGLACVITRVGGAEYILEDGRYGILIPPQAPHILADTFSQLADNPQEIIRLGELARQRAQSHFDIIEIGKRYQELYVELLKRKRG